MFRIYLHWLHTQWPAGRVEKLPEAAADGSTNVYGLYVAGDLRGIPLLKFAADSGARVVRTIAEDSGRPPAEDGVADLAIVGGGVAGLSAALEASGLGLTYRWFEASEPFSTIVNFPKGKPIYTYPKDMVPEGSLRLSADVKEDLVDELRRQKESAGVRIEAGRVERVVKRGAVFDVEVAGQTEPARAAKVVVAIGRSGDIRRLGVPGEDLDKVYNRLHDPADFCGANTLVVGGGDTALETAIALANCGAGVTLCCRSDRLSRPKEENLEALEGLAENGAGRAEVRSPSSGRVTTASGDYLGGGLRRESVSLVLETQVKEIRPDEVVLAGDDGEERTIPNDVVFTMIGRDPPLDFFRRAGVAIRGEWTWRKAAGLAAFLLFAALLYNWKSGGQLGDLFYHNNWWPVSIASSLDADARPPGSLVGVVARSASTPSFWYTLAYSVLVVVFGLRRIRRRDMPYVTVQTWVLMAIQVLPLFVLPEILLPWLGNNGWLPQGFLDSLFPAADYGNGREYWRAYGLILAWPLNVYNVFTGQPLGWWLAISFVQTFVLIPAAIFFWGKGAYCGWVCSCGALAETLGDGQRHKMPHGPGWNRLNAAGQVLLAVATALLIVRVLSWALPGTGLADLSNTLLYNKIFGYKWVVDVFLAGVVGYGVYFWLSGRVWCRFFCPLAALMHIYARFSRFRILADKKKCISCNVCTSVCHMGIDVMNFANKGLPMRDPECVRCSACVYECPTGVLQFGRVDGDGRPAAVDNLPASPVRAREG